MPATDMPDHAPRQTKRFIPGHHALRKGRVSLPNHVYLVTTTTRERAPYFDSFAIACAAARCFDDARTLGDARMLAWVLMPDHVHWLIRLGDVDDLDAVINRLKSASARAVNRFFAGTVHCGRGLFTIVPCALSRTYGAAHVTSLPIPCAPDWWSGSGIIRSGMPCGFDNRGHGPLLQIHCTL